MSADPEFAAVILAAGASRRMGRTKALLDYRGETFLGRLTRVLGARCRKVIVVVPPAGLACPDGVVCVVNPAPERGMLTSLQCGLRAAPESADGVFFTPVDIPSIQPATLAALAAVPPATAVMPRTDGRRGHPVRIGLNMVAELLALPSTCQARDVIQSHSDEIVYVDVEDPGILADIDTEDDYARLLEDRAQ